MSTSNIWVILRPVIGLCLIRKHIYSKSYSLLVLCSYHAFLHTMILTLGILHLLYSYRKNAHCSKLCCDTFYLYHPRSLPMVQHFTYHTHSTEFWPPPSLTCAEYKDFPNSRRSLSAVGLGCSILWVSWPIRSQGSVNWKLPVILESQCGGHYFLAGVLWSSSFRRRCFSLSGSSISTESRGTVTLQLLFLKLTFAYTTWLFMLYPPWNSHCPPAVTAWL